MMHSHLLKGFWYSILPLQVEAVQTELFPSLILALERNNSSVLTILEAALHRRCELNIPFAIVDDSTSSQYISM